MVDPSSLFARYGREIAGAIGSLSVYAAVGMSVGAVAVLASRRLGMEPGTAFAAGCFTPVGPVYLVFASDWGMRRTLGRLKRWRDEGLIQAREYDELRRRALEWFALRRFGR